MHFAVALLLALAFLAPQAHAETPPPKLQVAPLFFDLRLPDGKFHRFHFHGISTWSPGFVVRGKPVPLGNQVFQLTDASYRPLSEPEFGELLMPAPGVVFGRLYGEKTLLRLATDGSGQHQRIDPQTLTWAVTNDRPNNYGLIPAEGTARPVVVVYDAAWKEAFRLRDAVPASAPPEHAALSMLFQNSHPVERLADDTVLAHHVDPDGKFYDVLYDPQGRPVSPPLPQLLRVPTGETTRQYIVPIAGKLYWPITPAGSPEPLPGHVLGLMPLISRAQWQLTYLDRLQGWAVKARFKDGTRWAVIRDLAALRANAIPASEFVYEDLTFPDYAPTRWIPFHFPLMDPLVGARRAGSGHYELYAWQRNGSGLQRWFPDRTFESAGAIWDFAVDTAARRTAIHQEQIKRDNEAKAIAARNAWAAERATLEKRFQAYRNDYFRHPQSREVAKALGPGHFALFCQQHMDACRNPQELSWALAGTDPRTPEYSALRRQLDIVAPPPPPREGNFRVGDLFGTDIPKDNSFQNYQRGWQNWYYKDGQLVVYPR